MFVIYKKPKETTLFPETEEQYYTGKARIVENEYLPKTSKDIRDSKKYSTLKEAEEIKRFLNNAGTFYLGEIYQIKQVS